ncbi:MAG: hypothetical protein Kow00128_23860 [Deltaproteobacteria bacterium]
MTHSNDTSEDLLQPEFMKRVVREALDARGAAAPESLRRLEQGIASARIVVDGFNRNPARAPTARLLDPIVENIDDPELFDGVVMLWMGKRSDLVGKARAHLAWDYEKHPDRSADPVRLARSFHRKHPEVPLEEAALVMSVLLETDVDVEEEIGETGPMAVRRKGRGKEAADRERERARKQREKREALERELKEAKARIAEREREIRELRKEIEKQRQGEEERVRRDVEEYRRRMRLEFASPEEKERAVHAKEDLASLLAEAESVMARQKERNARYGTIREIRERYRRLGEHLEELRVLREESVLVSPEVDRTIAKLSAACEAMRADPALSGILPGRGDRLRAIDLERIGDLPVGKASLPQLERLSRMIPELERSGLLSEEACEEIRLAVRRKLERILLKEGIPEETPRGTFEESARRGRLSGKTLVIDGNNVLLTCLLPPGEKVLPDFEGKREEFNRAVARGGRHFRQVFVVYDGVENDTRIEGNVSVIYTDNKTEKISADDRIAGLVAELPEGNAVLATNDSELIDRCPRAEVVCSRDCFDFFRSAKG